jgi:hypothetical protein
LESRPGFITTYASHAEGYRTKAIARSTHSEGENTQAGAFNETTLELSGIGAHAEGNGSIAKADSSHAEGANTKAFSASSHAEGYGTTTGIDGTTSGKAAHAEGNGSIAKAAASHAEGTECKAEGPNSHAGGYKSVATGESSFAQGFRALAGANSNNGQAALGRFNDKTDAKDILMVGEGTSNTDRRNCFATGNDGSNSYIKIGRTKITESQLQALLALIS